MNGTDVKEMRKSLSLQLVEMNVGEIERFPLSRKRTIRTLTSTLKRVAGQKFATRADSETNELIVMRIK